MTSQHSPEPWFAEDDFVLDSSGESIGWISHGPSPLNVTKADAARIIACVNACAGIPAEELHMLKLWRGYYQRNIHMEGGLT